MHSRLFHLHALSALHCGTGQSVGVVDLPIARARATQLPIVPGSSLRGVLRQEIGARNPDLEHALFGPRTVKESATSFAGALAVGDAHLLALPVRSLAGILCYATSPFILTRYARDLTRAGLKAPELPKPARRDLALVAPGSANLLDRQLVLEDLDLGAQTDALAQEWAETISALVHPEDAAARADLECRFAILPDDILGFLSETATELRTRISIDEQTGTVKKGALWFEEHLPAESILWGLYALSASNQPGQPQTAEDLAGTLRNTLPTEKEVLLQLGGQAGVGRGLVRLLIREETV